MAAKSAGVLMLAAIILFIAAKQCAAQSRVVRGIVTDESGAVIPKTSIDISCSQTGRVWSDDFVVTNPLNKFVNKQQAWGMVQSGFLVITSYERQIEYVRVYDNIEIVAGSETVVWGGKNAERWKNRRPSLHWYLDETTRPLSRSRTTRKRHTPTINKNR